MCKRYWELEDHLLFFTVCCAEDSGLLLWLVSIGYFIVELAWSFWWQKKKVSLERNELVCLTRYIWKEMSFGGIEWPLHQLESPSSKTSCASLMGWLYPLLLLYLIYTIFFPARVGACLLSNNHDFVYLQHMQVVFPLALSIMLRQKMKNKRIWKRKRGERERGGEGGEWKWLVIDVVH